MKGLLDAYEGALCGPVKMEFMGGARASEVDRIRTWFDLIPYVRNDLKIWREAAGNYRKLKAKGYTIPWNDILIATIAIRTSLRVYAKEKHFTTMAEVLGMSIYQPGYNGMYHPEA
jgi:predicted nucleic acid-binding protein